jgi:aminoglycoside phosphotransferase (APT) family kinase protein
MIHSIAALQRLLQSYFEFKFPSRRRVHVSVPVNMTSGWGHEMFSFDCEYQSDGMHCSDALVLRIFSGDDASLASQRECVGMHRLLRTGFPVPHVHALESGDSAIGEPFIIMERIKGRTLWPLIPESVASKQVDLRSRFCELLVRLHKLDWMAFIDYATGSDVRNPFAFVDTCLAKEEKFLRLHSQLDLLPALKWLQMRRADVPCFQPAMVHDDYHYQNVLLSEDDSMLVIDWSGLRVSDARFDLAWMLLLQRTHIGVEERNLLLREYERFAECRIQELEWFEVFASLRRLRIFAALLDGKANELGVHPGAAALAKQNLEPLKRVYEFMAATTGVESPSIESLL